MIITIILIIIVVIIVFLTLLNAKLTGRILVGKNTTKYDAKSKPPDADLYGKYVMKSQVGCTTASGKCTDYGTNIVTYRCVPHSKTNKGCLNLDGVETSEDEVRKENCKSQCRQFIWDTPIEGKCTLEENSLPCISSGVKLTATKTTEHTCVAHDGFGLNNCNYLCGTGIYDYDDKSNDYIPACKTKGIMINIGNFDHKSLIALKIGDKCNLKLGKGYSITSKVGNDSYDIIPQYKGNDTVNYETIKYIDQKLTVTENCNVDNTMLPPICGVWTLPDSTSSKITVSTHLPSRSPMTSMIEDCTLSTPITKNSQGNYDPFRLFEVGYTTKNMICVNSSNKTPGVCLPLVTFVSSYTDVMKSLKTNKITTYMDTSSNDKIITTPAIASYCYFMSHNLDKSQWATALQPLIGNIFLVKTTKNNAFLSLNNVPCSVDSKNCIQKNYKQSEDPLYDCLGDPLKPLKNTNLMLYPNMASSFWSRPNCSPDEIALLTSLGFLIKPFPSSPNADTEVNISNSVNCNIIAVLGSIYRGSLDIDEKTNYLIWKQSDFNEIETTPKFSFILENNIISLRHISGAKLNVKKYGDTDRQLENLTIDIISPLDSIPGSANLDSLFMKRQQRTGKTSCNILFNV